MKEKEFARLVREHKSTIYTVCYMFSQDADEVADLVQEVLINLWQGYKDFRGDSALKTWVYRISLNTCISERRRDRRHPTVPLGAQHDLFAGTSAEGRQIRQLYGRINRLPPLDRAIVLLWLEQMSYEEIGAIVGLTAKNISVRLYRIKEELKKMSNDETN